MHELLDDYAHTNALRDVSPRLKMLLGLVSILLCVSSPSPAAPLFAALTMSLATVLLARVPGRLYLKLLLVPLSFALLSSLAILLVQGTGEQILAISILGQSLAVREGGVDLALLLLSRTLGGTASLFFIALTTPMVEIFSALKSLRLPGVLIELSMLVYRYIFVLLDQALMIHNAQVMRLGHSNMRSCLNSLSLLSSVLFLRSWEQGERLLIAMDSRCYSGRLDVMERDVPLRPKEVLAALTYISMVAAIAIVSPYLM